MRIENVPFTQTSWDAVPRVEYKGDTGSAWWRTLELGNIRVRMVEYSPAFPAAHGGPRAHILLALKGDPPPRLKDGRTFLTRAGESWQVGEADGEHRSASPGGALLFIVD